MHTTCYYSLVVKLDYRITGDVSHVDESAFLDAFRVLSQHKPPDVCVQEASVRVMWIAVRLRVLVMDAVIAHPVVDGVLAGNRVAAHQNDP